ncbi:MAG: Gfo/Idh/MocA family protein [Acutalibacteraceae bacterium]
MTNFAVIGVGRMGTVHAMNLYFRRVRGARLYAVCDTDPAALAKAAKRFPRAKRFADVEALLADGKVEAVVIATPHYAHADIAVACLEKGVHVLVEKPLSVTAADARRVIDASKRNPKTVAAVMLN